jgi:multidrug resistance efflux pump
VQLANARATWQRNQQLVAVKAQTQEALDNSKAAADQLEKEVENAEANLNQSSARVRELQADIAYYRTVLAQKRVVAPVAGKLLDVPVLPGDFLSNETVVAEMAPTGALIAKTEVDEIFAQKVKTGQKAEIRSQTTGEKIGAGEVCFAAEYLKAKSLFKDQSTEQEDRRVREVHIKLDPGSAPLIGSRVDCVIFID